MRKEYPKLNDIDEDIWAYQAKLKSLEVGTLDYKTVSNYLSNLRVKRKALKKKNAGNPSFFHRGIPPMSGKPSRKQQKLNAIDRAIREVKSRCDKELSDLYRERDEVKKF